MTTIVEARYTHRYSPVGECIYCGATSSLSDEHIIPFGLGGNMVLPKSSCAECAAITSKVERAVLRGFMHDARLVAGFPTRHKRTQPDTVEVTLLGADGSTEVRDVDPAQALTFMTMPVFAPPAILAGKPPCEGVALVGADTLGFGVSPERFAAQSGAAGVQHVSNLNAITFCRFLAKIAYAYLVADQGLFPRAETPLIPLILGDGFGSGSWIGSSKYTLEVESQRPTHALGIVQTQAQDGSAAFIVRVKLFADVGATGFEILARMSGWQGFAAQQADRADNAPRSK
jgi:hypothetical protein